MATMCVRPTLLVHSVAQNTCVRQSNSTQCAQLLQLVFVMTVLANYWARCNSIKTHSLGNAMLKHGLAARHNLKA